LEHSGGKNLGEKFSGFFLEGVFGDFEKNLKKSRMNRGESFWEF